MYIIPTLFSEMAEYTNQHQGSTYRLIIDPLYSWADAKVGSHTLLDPYISSSSYIISEEAECRVGS